MGVRRGRWQAWLAVCKCLCGEQRVASLLACDLDNELHAVFWAAVRACVASIC